MTATGRNQRTLAGAGLSVGAAFALAPAAAHAIEVTNANPSGPGSLAIAVFAVNSSPTEDTITFASSLSGQTITTAGQLTFDADEIYIQGPGADRLTISGGSAHRIFVFDPDNLGDPAEVRGLTLTNGNGAGQNGGAITNIDADMLVADSVIRNSTAARGGGIWTGDNIVNRIERSTISGNTATSGGGGIYGDDDFGTIASSTITGNQAAFAGGVSVNGPVAISDSTIAGNRSLGDDKGAGVYNEGGVGSVISLDRTIVADNINAAGETNDLSNAFSVAFSLVESPSGGTIATTAPGSNLLGIDPQLGPLAANGGPTGTMRPSLTSPALDKSGSGGPATDQRGLPRPFDVASILNSVAPGANASDIGAVELQASDFPTQKCKKKKKKKGKKRAAEPSAKKPGKKKKKKKCKKKRKKKKKK